MQLYKPKSANIVFNRIGYWFLGKSWNNIAHWEFDLVHHASLQIWEIVYFRLLSWKQMTEWVCGTIIPVSRDAGKASEDQLTTNASAASNNCSQWGGGRGALFNMGDRSLSLAFTFPTTSRFIVLMKQGQPSGDCRAPLLCSLLANMLVTKAQWNTLTGTHLTPSILKNEALKWKWWTDCGVGVERRCRVRCPCLFLSGAPVVPSPLFYDFFLWTRFTIALHFTTVALSEQ